MRTRTLRAGKTAAPAMPRAKVQTMLSPGDVFVAKLEDGRTVASNRYWIVDAERLTGLFEWWNLTVEPGAYYVNGNVSRTLMKPPDMDALVVPPKKRASVGPLRAGTQPLLYEKDRRTFVLFEQRDGEAHERFGLNRDFLDFVAPTWNTGEVSMKQDPTSVHKPVYFLDGSKVTAVLMPARLT